MKLTRLFTLGAALAFASIASAHTSVFTTLLSGAAEAPPNASPATGFARVTIDLDLVTMRLETNFTGLTGTVTAAHIHGPTAVAGTGTAGVMTMTPSFAGFPHGASSGSYDQTFDLTLNGSYNASFITAQGGTSQALNALVAAIEQGKAYLNIHTTTFGGGEIRGFFTPIPEPSSAAGLAGLLALGSVSLRRRRR